MAISNPFPGIGAGVSDIFQGEADRSKASYDLLEGQEYTEAQTLAEQNEQFTAQSTQIKEAQINREVTASLGKTQAQVAGAGFATSGSALDILRSSAQQGAVTKAVASEQGLITEAGYQEQASSYGLMAQAAQSAAAAENKAAEGADIGAALQFAGVGFNLLTAIGGPGDLGSPGGGKGVDTAG